MATQRSASPPIAPLIYVPFTMCIHATLLRICITHNESVGTHMCLSLMRGNTAVNGYQSMHSYRLGISYSALIGRIFDLNGVSLFMFSLDLRRFVTGP